MAVTVGEVNASAEVAPAIAGPAGAATPAPEALEPTWSELDRHRLVADLAAESRARTDGCGYGESARAGLGGWFDG